MRPFLARKQILTQLVVASETMHRVDELLEQLATGIVHHFGVKLAQCWMHQMNDAGQPTIQLGALVRQDPSLPEHVVANEYMTRMALHMASGQYTSQPQPVETIFSPFQSTLLKRYGLHCCVSYLLTRNVFLPPGSEVASQEHPSIHFKLITWLFLQHSPHLDFVPTIKSILEQAITFAESHGLFLPTTATADQPPKLPVSPIQEALPALLQLIPHRKQNAKLLLESNPFADPFVTSDKKTRHLYTVINGRSSVGELCNVTGMEVKEAFAVLQQLLTQQRIEMYTPEGQLLDVSLFLNNQ